MSFTLLPTELRQIVIEEVLTTPFTPPSAPSEVRSENWFYPYEENKRRHSHAHLGESESNPAIAFNTQGPWGRQYLPLLLVSKAFKADTQSVLKRIGRHVQPTLDVMLERDGDFKATWLLVPPSAAAETKQINIVLRTVGCMSNFRAEGSKNVPFKRNANVSVGRLLQRITSIGFSPYANDRQALGTQIRKLCITIVAPVDTKSDEMEDERAPLAARLSEYLSLGHFEELSQKIDGIDIFVDDRKLYSLSKGKSHFKMEWSHKWRRDSAMEA